MNNNFNKDLPYGKQIELEFIELLKMRGYMILEQCDNWMFDVAFAAPVNGLWRVWHSEIKGDYKNKETGNVAIEFESRGIISGISTTLADRWFQKLEDGFWEIKTQRLKEIIKQKQFKDIKSGGDPGSNTRFYIFDGNYFRKQGKKFE